MKRLRLDCPVIAKDNPRVVCCSISGFGQEGPGANAAAYAPVIQADSGYELAHTSYQDDTRKPAASGIFMADVLGAIHVPTAISLALFASERTNPGQYIDVALMDAVVAMLICEPQDTQFRDERTQVPYRPMRTTDGFVVMAVVTSRNLEALFSVIGYPEGHVSVKTLHSPEEGWDWPAITSLMENWTRTRSMAQVEAELGAAGVPISRYRTLAQSLSDPQSVYRKIQANVGGPGGEFGLANPPFRMSRVDVHARPKVLSLGEDTDRVLAQILGCSAARVSQLKEVGQVGPRAAAGVRS